MTEKISIKIRLSKDGFYVNDALYKAALTKSNTVENISNNIKTVLEKFFDIKYKKRHMFDVKFISKNDINAESKGNAIFKLSSCQTQLEYSYDGGCHRVDGIVVTGTCRPTCTELKAVDEKSFKSAVTDLMIKIYYQLEKKKK